MSKAARLAELRALRAAGKTRLSTYEVTDAEAVYDEVDEEGYKKVVRSRLDRDDFVVEDDGQGYADDGREDWQHDRRYHYATDSEEEEGSLRSKAAKRKREEDREREEKVNSGITKYFNANPAATGAAPKSKHNVTAADHAFLDNLLNEVDVNTVSVKHTGSMRTIKSEARRKTRVLSPPIKSENKTPYNDSKFQQRDSLATPQVSSGEDDENDLPRAIEDEDTQMSDPVAPSSPVTQAVERKAKVQIKTEEEEEDDSMEVAQAVVRSGFASANVNMSGTRLALKKKETAYPTPESSSPTRPAPESIDASSWTQITSKLNVLSSPPTDAAAVGKMQAKDALEEDGSLRFFWFDYTEINGSLLLFGKVKDKTSGSFVSCFVKVDGILRKLFFLPREYRQKLGKDTSEEITLQDVYTEVASLMSKNRITEHKSKPSTRKYAFEIPDVPKEAEYLKLLYPYDGPALPMDLTGESFSHVFGTNTSLFEQFVLWKNIMGPCWLKINDADFHAVTNASWCKLELQVNKPNSICTLGDSDNLEAPPLTLMSIALRTVMNVKENKQEILVASARIYENVSLSDTTPPEKLPCKTLTIMRPIGENYPTGFKSDVDQHVGTVRLEKTESALLSLFLANLQKVDPDVLIGHRLEDLDYSILLSRLRERKTPGWHRIGRLRRSEWPKHFGKGAGSFFAERQIVAGRLICDLANDQGKSLMTKCQSWSLTEMCELVLGRGNIRRDIDNEAALKTWATSREGLMNYMKHCEADTFFIAAIALKIQMLPLTKVLTNLAGNSWARTLTGTRAERNEYILLHEFHRNKYICPDKVFAKTKDKFDEEPADGEDASDVKKKDKYKGGLVFEPEKGLYDRIVLVMDFNSLYPSIIQEYNICFTTVERANFSEEDEKVPEVPGEQDQGILPRLIAKLVNRRREVKKLMKDKNATPDELATWDIKQLALKLTANSMYGCLGYTRSRFYARPLAMLTTYKGREILQSTKELAESKQLQVIYGDTDSVMINTNLDNVLEALKVGSEFKRAVNERYRLLEIDIDNTFRRLLLHAKKKYAAINLVEIDGKFVEKLEVKGLDMRRREYCALAKETSSKLLNLLLSGEEPEVTVEKIHDYLRELAGQMREFKVPARKYTIFTQLGKAPNEYQNSKSMPSVQVGLRLQAKGKSVRAKDVMAFIITGQNGSSAESAASNAFPPDEVVKVDSGLQPDVDFYLHKQILPPVERLCAPITLTNISRLAECLGLDTSVYRISANSGEARSAQELLLQPLDSQVPDFIRFAACSPLRFHCLNGSCTSKASMDFRSLDLDSKHVSNAGITCSCGAVLPNLAVVAQLEHQIRALLCKYYEARLICDDPSCGNTTRQISVYGHRCLGPTGLGHGCRGRMRWVMNEKSVWTQLMYWERAFDMDRARAKVAPADNKVVVKREGDGASTSTDNEREKVRVLASNNHVRFETCRDVVRGYLNKNGRQWVNMSGLFNFMST